MKLLLTSSGVDNRSISESLQQLTRKKPGETKIGFVPTAINAEGGNKDWAVNQFLKLWRYGYNWIDIVDPSAAGTDWQARLELCDTVFISGGNTFHLLDQVRKTGFDKWLEAHKDSKVFVGSSAGSIIFTPTIDIAAADYGDENLAGLKDLTALGWADFEVAPHYEQSLDGMIAKYSAGRQKIYAIDDQTAIKVDGNEVGVITEGFWKLYND